MPNYPMGRIMDGYRRAFYRRETRDGIPIHRVWVYASQGVGLRRMLNYFSFLLTSLFALLRAQKPDFLFVESPPLFLGMVGWLAARLWRVPWIFTVADLWPDSISELHVLRQGPVLRAAFALERWTYRHASRITAVTWAIRQQLLNEKHVPEEKLLFLPNGVDTELFTPVPADPVLAQRMGLGGKHIVIFPGNHGYAHCLDSILQTAEKLRDKSDICFLLVGSGSAKHQLQADVERLGLHNIMFLDPVATDQLPQLISLATCGLVTMRDIPLLRDARPVKAITLMSCGKAIVLAVGEGSGTFLTEAGAGLVVPINDAIAISQAIRHMIDHPDEAKRFGTNGREYICHHLQWDTLVDRWLHQLLVSAPLRPEDRIKVGHHATATH